MPDRTTTHSTVIPGMHYRNAADAIENTPERHMKLPAEVGGAQTRGVSLIVKDADAIYARAKDAGATIVEDIESKPYGGRGFACLDPEGHIWHVGTYDPWAPK